MHIHTQYCGHAPGMSVRAIIFQADSLGLDTIAITSHVFGPDNLGTLDLIRDDIKKTKSNCRVIVGTEVDVDWRSCDGRLVTDNLDNIDYVVASIHYIPTVGKYPFTPDDNILDPAKLFEYWRTTLLGTVSNPVVDTLAHPGRMIATSIKLDVYFEDVLVVLNEAAKLSAENNIAWELNELTGYRLNYHYQQQWHRIYQIALKHGVKLIYGSDAHDIQSIGRCAFTNSILENLPGDSLAGPMDFDI